MSINCVIVNSSLLIVLLKSSQAKFEVSTSIFKQKGGNISPLFLVIKMLPEN